MSAVKRRIRWCDAATMFGGVVLLVVEWVSGVGDDTLYIGATLSPSLWAHIPPRRFCRRRRRWSHLNYDWPRRTTRYLYIILIQLHLHRRLLPTYVISFIIYDPRQIIIIGANASPPRRGRHCRRRRDFLPSLSLSLPLSLPFSFPLSLFLLCSLPSSSSPCLIPFS